MRVLKGFVVLMGPSFSVAMMPVGPFGGVGSAGAAGFSEQAELSDRPSSFADLAEFLLPTVVNISSAPEEIEETDKRPEGGQRDPRLPNFPEGSPFDQFFEEFLDNAPRQRAQPSAMGSGFVIDAEKGYIITNNHVVRSGGKVQAIFSNNKTVLAEIVGVDAKTDIALLKIDPAEMPDLTEAKFGDSSQMRVGDWILAIGNPFGLGGTVTAGIISARARDINAGPYDDYLQTDASINRGNSGGPMFNTKGEVIGINTAIFSPTGGSVGIGFAIPSSQAQPVIEQLIKYGRTRRGWLGVRIQSVTEEIAESLSLDDPRGALVAGVTAGGPSVGVIKTGDVILSFDGKAINEMKELPRSVAEADIGKTSKVVVWRDGKEQSFDIKLGELEKAEEDGLLTAQADRKQVPAEISDALELKDQGITVAKISPILAEQHQVEETVTGLIIVKVAENSAAEARDLRAGDVILEINQKAITEPKAFQEQIETMRKEGKVSALLLVNRRGNVRFVALKLDAEK